MPVIMAGIRTSAVWVIGTATLSTPIGQTSLGNYIFSGLQTQNWVFVLFGCVAAAVLALVVDQLLALMEYGVDARSRAQGRRRRCGPRAGGAGGAGAAVMRPRARHLRHRRQDLHRTIYPGALIQQRLAANGLTSAAARRARLERSSSTRSAAGEIDVYVDYSGTIWANEMHRSDVKPRDEVLRRGCRLAEEQRGMRMLGALGFENAYALAMPRATRRSARHQFDRRSGGDTPRIVDRRRLRILRASGMEGAAHAPMACTSASSAACSPTFMYQATANGDVDVISAFSSDGRIAKYDLIVLDDPRHAHPAL